MDTICPVPEDTAELADLAASSERRHHYWRNEFEWVLNHGALEPVIAEPALNPGLWSNGFANQFGLSFRVTGRPDGFQQSLRRETVFLARRIAPMMAAGASVCVDLSTAARHCGSLESIVPYLLANLPGALAVTGIKPDRLWFSCACGDSDLPALQDLRDEPALGRPGILLRLPDQFLLSICKPV